MFVYFIIIIDNYLDYLYYLLFIFLLILIKLLIVNKNNHNLINNIEDGLQRNTFNINWIIINKLILILIIDILNISLIYIWDNI